MLGSNQRPLPCESEPCSFAEVRRYPIFAFPSLIPSPWTSAVVRPGCRQNCRQAIACLSFRFNYRRA